MMIRCSFAGLVGHVDLSALVYSANDKLRDEGGLG